MKDIILRLNENLFNLVDELAILNDTSRTDIIRTAIKKYCKNNIVDVKNNKAKRYQKDIKYCVEVKNKPLQLAKPKIEEIEEIDTGHDWQCQDCLQIESSNVPCRECGGTNMKEIL